MRSRANQRTVSLACFLALQLAAIWTTAAQAESPAEPAFEVASVKSMKGLVYKADISVSGTRVTASGPLKHLIEVAYQKKIYLIVGGPGWVGSGDVLFEVIGKTERPVSMEEARRMLQTLLAERFQLRHHLETREVAVYNLVSVKVGPKLKKADPDETFGLSVSTGPVSRIAATAYMQSLCNQLTAFATDRPVVDKTGLNGLFKFTLEWSREGAAPEGEGLPSVYTAVEEQLGLKLRPSRDPVEVIVIDRAERPTGN